MTGGGFPGVARGFAAFGFPTRLVVDAACRLTDDAQAQHADTRASADVFDCAEACVLFALAVHNGDKIWQVTFREDPLDSSRIL